MKRTREALAWLGLTLPLAAIAALAYFAFEWLFFVTKPSALAAMSRGQQIETLLRAPLPLMPVLLGVQAAASLMSLVRYPKFRAAAVVPAAVVGGALLLVLVDNFTYTLFGQGVLTSAGILRVTYAAAVPVLIVLAGNRLWHWTQAVSRRRGSALSGAAAAAVIAVAPLAASRAPERPDLSAPPTLAGREGTAQPNVLILGIDGVDAPLLSAYGYARDTSPYLARLADESLVFENAFANVGRTHGSLVALLSGRLPFSTRVTFPPTVLQGEDAHRHLPALLEERGYSTLQLGMRHYADAEDANLLGFDAANYRWQDLDRVQVGSAAADEVAVFRRDVAERVDERLGYLFGFRHAIDTYAHVEGRRESPYWKDARRVDTLVRYLPSAPEPWFVHTHFLDTHCCAYRPQQIVFSGPNPQEDARDSQVREADEHVRRVVETLRTSGRLERTVVVITSDHTNGWTTKGRVPLLIRFPNATLKGRVSANVQLADVAPTVLDFLGAPIPRWMDGVSLLAAERLDPSRPIFGISEVAGRHAEGFLLSALDDAGPPNYGAGSATVVLGDRWFELSLDDGRMQSGPVPGHTAVIGRDATEREARRLLAAKLDAAGFRVPTPSTP